MRSGKPGLHRIDSHVVAEILAAETSAPASSDFSVMLDAVIGRLVAVEPASRRLGKQQVVLAGGPLGPDGEAERRAP